jgi:serine phosphatase RsbU (regulator of sigma subunit)/anti-sigma regulatory factor (Ser/Thr protein kinase)
MPHGMCYLWQPGILSLHIISDALIAFAYVAIALILAWFVSKRRDLPFKTVFLMFALFIISCALTHALAIWVIWRPDYWADGVVKAITATASIATAILLAPLMPKALSLRSPRELEALNGELEATLQQLHDVVRSYEHEKYIAGSFQSASLSDVPSHIDHVDISAMYRPGSGDLEIGGDWYDAFALLDGRIVTSIGDVTGTGLAASIIMSKVRQAIRVAAQIQVDPARILDAASRSLEIEFPDAIVTAFVGIIDPAEDILQYANAGHPLPLIRLPDASLIELTGSALPLGLRRRGEEQSREWALRPGSLVVLYTDGLTESTRNYLVGETRLRRTLALDEIAHVTDPARTIFDAVLFDGIRDDVAILTLRLPASVGKRTNDEWNFDSADAAAAADVRGLIAAKLAARGASGSDIFNADMVFSELMGNVCRYAPGAVSVAVDWRRDTLVLHVMDNGAGFEFLPELPDDLMSERGRGLFIVNALVEDFHIKRRRNGGSHASAVLRSPRPPVAARVAGAGR